MYHTLEIVGGQMYEKYFVWLFFFVVIFYGLEKEKIWSVCVSFEHILSEKLLQSRAWAADIWD